MEKFIIISLLCAVALILIVIVGLLKIIEELRNRIYQCQDAIQQLEDKLRSRISKLEEQLKPLPQQILESKKDMGVKKIAPVVGICKEHQKPQLIECQGDTEHVLYASSYDSENNQFFTIESAPTQKTVYEITYLESNPDVGYFIIYKEAESKVVECRDHLDTASEIEGRGKGIDWNNINPGKLQRKNNNNWEVVKPLTVKFV